MKQSSCRLSLALVAAAFAGSGMAVPAAAVGPSLDNLLADVEFCRESRSLKSLRADLNAMFPVRHAEGTITYRIGANVRRRVDGRVPGRVSSVTAREDTGHMMFKIGAGGSYRGIPVRSIELWNGGPHDGFYGFGVEFAAPQRQVEAMFGPAVSWVQQNRGSYCPAVFAMIASSRPIIVCRFSD